MEKMITVPERHVRKLLDRLAAHETSGGLGDAIAKAISGDAVHPAQAGAELIAREVRTGSTSYGKALKKVGIVTPDEALRKQRDKRDGDPSGYAEDLAA